MAPFQSWLAWPGEMVRMPSSKAKRQDSLQALESVDTVLLGYVEEMFFSRPYER
jgi:hypothetical protein